MMLQGMNRKAFTASKPTAGRKSTVACVSKRDAAALVATTAAAVSMAMPAQAAEIVNSTAAVDSSLSFAVGGGVAIAGLGALLVATDPQKR